MFWDKLKAAGPILWSFIIKAYYISRYFNMYDIISFNFRIFYCGIIVGSSCSFSQDLIVETFGQVIKVVP